MHKEQMRVQKQKDDVMVGLIMRALENGIEIDNDVYRSVLEEYPFYQVKLEKRQKQIKSIKKIISDLNASNEPKEPPKYKFEHLKSRRNLGKVNEKTQQQPSGITIDAELVAPSDNIELQTQHYLNLLREYEQEQV